MDTPREKFFLQHEIIQAYTRILFIGVLGLVLGYVAFYGDASSLAYTNRSYLFAALFFTIALLHLYGLKRFPHANPELRKFFILHIDILAALLSVWIFDAMGLMFGFIFIWIILGYTLRFGKRFLPVSLLSSIIAVLSLSLFHPLWKMHPGIPIAASFALVLIPLFVIRMIGEIDKKNEELFKLLNRSDYLAHHDALTKLPNRTYFYEYLDKNMSENHDFCLLFIDLDGFKAINDRFGHETGDIILREVSSRMRQKLSEKDFIARLGGDEFVVISTAPFEDMGTLCSRLIESLAHPYLVADRKVDSLTASIGISSYPHDATDAFLLKKYADTAMYAAKQSGKNRCQYYRHCSNAPARNT